MENLTGKKYRLQVLLCEASVLIQPPNLRHLFEKLLSLASANVLLSQPYQDIVSTLQKFLDELKSQHSDNAVSKLLKALKELNFNNVAGE